VVATPLARPFSRPIGVDRNPPLKGRYLAVLGPEAIPNLGPRERDVSRAGFLTTCSCPVQHPRHSSGDGLS
jgi:hypothetical protein